MDWFLYDRDLRRERVKNVTMEDIITIISSLNLQKSTDWQLAFFKTTDNGYFSLIFNKDNNLEKFNCRPICTFTTISIAHKSILITQLNDHFELILSNLFCIFSSKHSTQHGFVAPSWQIMWGFRQFKMIGAIWKDLSKVFNSVQQKM